MLLSKVTETNEDSGSNQNQQELQQVSVSLAQYT